LIHLWKRPERRWESRRRGDHGSARRALPRQRFLLDLLAPLPQERKPAVQVQHAMKY
jgi:hypothetical protein